MEKKRNDYIDYVKGIAIILVVIGHSVQYGSGKDYLESAAFFSNPIFKFIYSFHMPLFMAISGYLFFNTIKKESIDIITGKIKGILIPIISFHTLYLAIKFTTGTMYTFKEALSSYFHTLWFLWSLLFACMLTQFSNRFFKDNLTIVTIFCLSIHFIPNSIIPDKLVFTILYFIAGYYFHKYISEKPMFFQKDNKVLNLIFMCIIPLFTFLLINYHDIYYVYVSHTYILAPNISLDSMTFITFYRHMAAITRCLFILILIWKSRNVLKAKPVSSTLTICSRISICIYIVNSYLNEYLLLPLPIYGFNPAYIIIETAVIIIISYFVAKLLQQNRITSLLFLGGR